jgi:hypothetical protein
LNLSAFKAENNGRIYIIHLEANTTIGLTKEYCRIESIFYYIGFFKWVLDRYNQFKEKKFTLS